jgi:prephenate dehydrogenase
VTDGTPVISIIGLGPLGRAIGLGLQAVKTRFELVGHDPDVERTRIARDSGAVDRVNWDLAGVAQEADLIIMTLPVAGTLHDLELIGPLVREGAVVTDTAPLKVPVLDVAERFLRPGASFVGGHLIARPDPDMPQAALKDATWCLVPSASADDAAVDVLSRLVRTLGASPYFISADEHDALSVGVGPLGLIMSSALVRLFAASPSARDLRRLAPEELRVRHETTDAETTFADLLSTSPDAILGWVDELMRELATARAALATGHDEWRAYLAGLAEARAEWEAALARDSAESSAAFEELDSANTIRDALFGRRRKR